MSQHVPPSRPSPGDRDLPGELNHPAAPHVLHGVPNAGTAPRSGRVADEAFVRALYAEHGGALLRYALHLTGGDRQRAEDLVQETIVRAWRHPEALADRPARPWLFAVARNLAVDSYRARQARPPETGQGALELLPADDDADRTLESWAVADALASLRPDHRRVIVETYYRGCSVAEAAATLGIPRQQVLNAIMIAAALACVTIPLFGVIGDRFGQRRVFALGALYLAAFAMVITELVPVCPGTPVQAIFGCWASTTCPTLTCATSCGADHVLWPSSCW